jgi:branched-chain amino acid transport system ATP-binding protein
MGINRDPIPTGSITFEEEEVIGWPAHKVLLRGISLVPEGREIFPLLSVLENIKIGHIAKRKAPGIWSFQEYLDKVIELFPILGKRLKNKGSQLSGGEQQMLAIARALGSRPKLLMLDEPTEGLAPMIIEKICLSIVELKCQGVGILLVTHGTKIATDLSSRIFFIEKGILCYEGTAQEVVENPGIRIRYLGV